MSEDIRYEISEELSCLNALIKEYGGVDSYTTAQAVTIFELICIMVRKLGLNPECRSDFFEGVCQIFNLQFVNMENYEHGKYVFVPNHVSEFDGVLFGIIIPHMLVVAKSDWVSNPRLNGFVEKFFSIVGVRRKDKSSGMDVIRRCIDHLDKSNDSAVTIFVQQTIADIEITTPEDVASGAYFIAKKTSAHIIPVYCEQVSTENPTRIVFGRPLICTDKNDFGTAWLRSELALRDSITTPTARPPMLCEKHKKPISQREF
ncbi:MAG: 1-acyl-sn-glycerol-3-phosphate acyltransferase [Tyzzerella sp.]|nr:1-acyl-sn-glycerol-3-phosphate acyltransferase [Tyzzerella sp.]